MMRGRLLASTALAAGIAGIGAPLHAQTAFQGPGSAPATTQNLPPTAQSAAPPPRFVIRIGGFFSQYIAAGSQDNVGTTAVSAAPPTTSGPAITSPINNASANAFSMTSDYRVTFTGSMSLDNGFVPGFVFELQNNLVLRRMYASLQSARFGEIRLGTENNAIEALLVRDPGLWRGYTTSFTLSAATKKLILNPSGSGFANTVFGDVEMFLGGVTRADQVMYLTPRIQGLQLAVSFAPEQSTNRSEANQIPLENGTGAIYRNVWTIGANYIWSFDSGITVRAGGGVQWASPPDQGGFGASVGSPTGVGGGSGAGTARTYQAALQVGYRGLTVGGAFNRMQGGRIMGTPGSTSLTAPGFPNTVVADGYVWIASAVYQFGPYGIGFTYFDARNSDCSTTGLALAACGRRDRMTVIALTGSYQLGPGVFWESALYHAVIRGNDWNNGNYVGTAPLAGGAIATTPTGVAQSGLQSNRAAGFVTGLAIMF